MPDVLTFYLNRIGKLRVNRNHGKPAPHKPLLLLAVIDLIEQGAIQNNQKINVIENFLLENVARKSVDGSKVIPITAKIKRGFSASGL